MRATPLRRVQALPREKGFVGPAQGRREAGNDNGHRSLCSSVSLSIGNPAARYACHRQS
jgi:hypothetical protein